MPCPFCGGEAQQPEFYGESKTARFINCKMCGASIYRGQPGENDATLIAAWNTREP
jgi:Lar family restriction alleviation protein